jgi:predicted dehydrogenase
VKTRRHFLFLTSALAARAAGPIRIGFLGGTHSHALGKAQAVLANPDWSLAGVVEEDAVALRAFAKLGVRALRREELLRDGSVPVIAVEGDVAAHFEDALAALEAGKHVHVEKPPALKLSQMKQLVELARKKNLLLQTGYMWRYHPAINAAIAAAKSGYLGDVYMVKCTINTLIAPDRRPDWGRFAGGQMFELGSHMVDAVVRTLGRPNSVNALLMKSGQFTDSLKDNTVAVFEYRRAMAIIQSATLQPGAGAHRSFEILGTKGTATVRPVEPGTLTIDLAEAAGPYKKGSRVVPPVFYRRYEDDFKELARAVRGETKLAMSLDEELLVQETLLRASGME